MKKTLQERQREIVNMFKDLRADREVTVLRLRSIDEEILRLQGEARLIRDQLGGGDVKLDSPNVEITREQNEVARQEVDAKNT